MAANMGIATCSVNATLLRLLTLGRAASCDCEPRGAVAPSATRVPMHGDTVLVQVVGGGGSSRAGGIGSSASASPALSADEAQALWGACSEADGELAAAALQLHRVLRGVPHLDLAAQHAAEEEGRLRADLAARRHFSSNGSSAGGGPRCLGFSADGGNGSADFEEGATDGGLPPPAAGNGSGHSHRGDYWPASGISFEEAVADACLSLVLASDGAGAGPPRLAPAGPCSALVSAALDRFNAALAAAQAALDAAAAAEPSSGAAPSLRSRPRYRVDLLPRAAAAALPLARLRHDAGPVGGGGPSPSPGPAVLLALGQQLLGSFHAFSLEGLVELGRQQQQQRGAALGNLTTASGRPRPLGPLEVAMLGVGHEVAAAQAGAHAAMDAYASAQARKWEEHITTSLLDAAAAEAEDRAGAGNANGNGDHFVAWPPAPVPVSWGGAGLLNGGAGGALKRGELDQTRRGGVGGIVLEPAAGMLPSVPGGVCVGDPEGVVVLEEVRQGGKPQPSNIGARGGHGRVAMVG